MKKMMMMLAAVLCCAMTTTVFTACGDDDDDNSTPSTPKIVGYQVDYSLDFPKETTQSTGVFGNLYLLCSKIEVAYVDANGQEQREVVNNGKWSKSVTYKKNLNGYLKLYLTKPGSLDVESLPYDKYTNSVTVLPTIIEGISAVYSDGTKKDATYGSIHLSQSSSRQSVASSNLQAFFDDVFKEEVTLLTIGLEI